MAVKRYKTIADFMENLEADKKMQVKVLRSLILGAEPRLQEHIKWNAPSYTLDGEDRITFNLVNKQGVVKIVLHMGATRKEKKKGEPVMKDESGLIEWSSDIRGTLTFELDDNIQSKRAVLKNIFDVWLAIPSEN